MPRYTAYGLVIDSEIELPELVISVEDPDVHISFGVVPENIVNPVVKNVWFEASGTQFILRIDKISRYFISSRSTITIQPYSGAEERDVRIFLYTSVFAALLHMRECVALNGSAFVKDGKAVVLAGNSAAGNTAVALSLYDKGFEIMSDDLCAVRLDGDKVVLHSGIPRLCVWKDNLLASGRNTKDYAQLRGCLEKYAIPVDDRFRHGPAELSDIVLLQYVGESPITDDGTLKGSEKFTSLMRACFCPDVVQAVSDKSAHFRLASAVAKSVRFFKFLNNKQLCSPDEVAQQLLGRLL